MSQLLDVLRQKRGALAERWVDLVLASYPSESVPFLRQENDRFKNPLGATVRDEIAALLDGVLAGADGAVLAASIEAIVRLRAVQGFPPAEALRFVFQLKQAVRAFVPPGADVTADLRELDARIDELALVGFAAYVRCRERVFEVRAHEATARTYSLLKRAGLLVEAAEAGGDPAAPPVEGRS